jgi:hypothetical protein
MAEPKCPPEESFELVTPGRAIDELKQARYETDQFLQDLYREREARRSGVDAMGHSVYPPEWSELSRSFDLWRSSFLEYYAAHDEWLEAFDSKTVLRRAEIYRCEIIDWRKKLRELGGKTTGPEPAFPPPPPDPLRGVSETASSLGTLLLGAAALYAVVQFFPRGRK